MPLAIPQNGIHSIYNSNIKFPVNIDNINSYLESKGCYNYERFTISISNGNSRDISQTTEIIEREININSNSVIIIDRRNRNKCNGD